MSLFTPHPRLCKVNNLYQYVDAYIDLSKYKFNQQEKDFLCECIYSGDKSAIGIDLNSIFLLMYYWSNEI